ncbi:hypothetical protein Tfer_0633 [Thermincola ferriacetica]|uniref:Uncharacterized protein n=1 Tax=Thermincola ferriacetica TaxID=281456 RepID=A0A0L6W4R8_9FIRM|nr:hypothetical protein Tfer_0633 [Thermincola ferriacetica]
MRKRIKAALGFHPAQPSTMTIPPLSFDQFLIFDVVYYAAYKKSVHVVQRSFPCTNVLRQNKTTR